MAKSNAKLTNILTIEKDIQTKWNNEKIFEENAPESTDLKWLVNILSKIY